MFLNILVVFWLVFTSFEYFVSIENSERLIMSSFMVQVASFFLGNEKPLSMNDINTFVKNNGTSTDFSTHEVFVQYLR